MIRCQRMTQSPEALERALLAVPMSVLLKELKWLGASEAYTCVQALARTMTEPELRQFLARCGEAPPAESAPTGPSHPAPAAPHPGTELPTTKRPAPVKEHPLLLTSLVALATGATRIQPGSLRERVLGALRGAPEQRASVSALALALGQDARPVVAKLRAAGWVKVI